MSQFHAKVKWLLIGILGLVFAGCATNASAPAACETKQLYAVGNPTEVVGWNTLAAYSTPAGKVSTVKYISLLAERHSGGLPMAGEFTVMLMLSRNSHTIASSNAPYDEMRESHLIVAQSSLEEDNGIALQAQGAADIRVPENAELLLARWLRANQTCFTCFFYELSVMIEECAA